MIIYGIDFFNLIFVSFCHPPIGGGTVVTIISCLSLASVTQTP